MSNETVALEVLPGASPKQALPTELATASQAVPLLWLAAFDYNEATAVPEAGGVGFSAQVSRDVAMGRLAALAEVFPLEPPVLAYCANLLARAIERQPDGATLKLEPSGVFGAMNGSQRRTYVGQLINLCDLWENMRGGLAWERAQETLERITPGIVGAISSSDERVARYYLLGSLADEREGFEQLWVRVGQSEDDQMPEALAVGDKGLVLGKFVGEWKLMESGVQHDLHAVWAGEKTAYAVGDKGCVLRFAEGKWDAVESGIGANLRAVWGWSDDAALVVGDQGTVLELTADRAAVLPVPTRTDFVALAGLGAAEIVAGGNESAVWIYDGRNWRQQPLEMAGNVQRIATDGEVIYAAGGSSKRTALFGFVSGRWVLDQTSPQVPWLAGIYPGWQGEVGVLGISGPAQFRAQGAWRRESIALEEVTAVTGGEVAHAAGRSSGYLLIYARRENGWQPEASGPGELRVRALWSAGLAKPARLDFKESEGNASRAV